MRDTGSSQSSTYSRSSGQSDREGHIEHVVFLVPGLLGFDGFSGFAYFADRAAAVIRAALERQVNTRVVVEPVPIPPTACLATRQRRLVRTLCSRIHALSPHRVPYVHLVGHSTGGVDANSLTSDTPLSGASWADLDCRAPALLRALRSVISLGSPHQGACIAKDPAAEFIRTRSPLLLPSVARLLLRVAESGLEDPSAHQLALNLTLDRQSGLRYLMDVFATGDLVFDLQPSRDRGPGIFRSDVLRRSIVTIAHTPEPGVASGRRPDALFRELLYRASGFATGCTEEGARVAASVERLSAALATREVPVIGSPSAKLPRQLAAWHSDGIVNTVRQLFDPNQMDELAAIVIADHYDVLGHYDRRQWSIDAGGDEVAVVITSGLLHSGSAFGDDEFFRLWLTIADIAASACTRAEEALTTESSKYAAE